MNDINVDFKDYRTILSHIGMIKGLIKSCNIDELLNIFDEKLKADLANAKGVLIIFELHDEQSLLIINDFMETVYNYTTNKCEVIFGTETNNILGKDIVNCKVIITGL